VRVCAASVHLRLPASLHIARRPRHRIRRPLCMNTLSIPSTLSTGCILPKKPGYSTEIFPETLANYSYRDGSANDSNRSKRALPRSTQVPPTPDTYQANRQRIYRRSQVAPPRSSSCGRGSRSCIQMRTIFHTQGGPDGAEGVQPMQFRELLSQRRSSSCGLGRKP
jgi:hypothetical protein